MYYYEMSLGRHQFVAVVFETHATSLDNEAGIASGWFDVDLSRAGERQAQALGLRHRADPPDIVFCSDLRRAWRTGEIAFGEAVAIVRDRRLRECDYGTMTRQPAADVEARRLECIDTPFSAGESYTDATRRVQDFLAETISAHAGQRILVIGHRATYYALEHLLNGRALREVIAAEWRWQPGWTYSAVS
jgi:2,3-bisphosphoglycerate-dependent phosphoglycerate mutase